jgi:tRNA(Ile)-lysidine synthase
MLQSFKKYMELNRLASQDDRILLAVSGGIDSMVMAHLFIRSGYNTGIAHCNFSLRGEESDHDEILVREMAEHYRVPFYSVRFSTAEYAKKNGISIQMAARDLRYEWFEEIRVANNFNKIAVAHNLNDNIETLLINLIRGTGIAGLTGIKASSSNIIRPLLFATREEIKVYCSDNGISYREDKSNAETKYIRNKIRHKVFPVFKEINPSVESTLSETVRRLDDVSEIVTCFTNDLKNRFSKKHGDITVFSLNGLKPYLSNSAIIFELFRPFGIRTGTLKDLLNIIKGKTGAEVITESHRIIRDRSELIITVAGNEQFETIQIGQTDDLMRIEGIVSASVNEITPGFIIPSCKEEICLDAGKLSFPLTVRHWQPGDSFFPLGMERKKKLSDYFTDRKYSINEKEKALVLLSDDQIVCIIGERIDNRYRITADSRKALIIKSVSGSN